MDHQHSPATATEWRDLHESGYASDRAERTETCSCGATRRAVIYGHPDDFTECGPWKDATGAVVGPAEALAADWSRLLYGDGGEER